MKRIAIYFILILVAISAKSQSYGKYFWAKDYVRSPYFISGGDTIAQWQKRGLNAVFLGNVGIGTTTPGGILEVKGRTHFSIPETSNGRFSVNSYFTGGSSGDIFALYTYPDKLILFDEEEQGYKVCIGEVSATELLNINGNAKLTGNVQSEGIISGKQSTFKIPNYITGIGGLNVYSYDSLMHTTDDIFEISARPDRKNIFLDEYDQGYNVLIGNTDTTEYKEKLTVNGKVKVNEYVRQGGVYGTMWTDSAVVSLSPSIHYQKLEAFTVDGLYNYTFPDHTVDMMTIFESGRYLVTLSGTMTSSYISQVRFAFFIDQIADENIYVTKYIQNDKPNDFSVTGTLYIGEDSQLEVGYLVQRGPNPLPLTFEYLNLTISYLGE